ncbi:head-tail connector protein [uncultured Cohaesibacter sp.]|uniref:head-tail connector protein n=1 Tax=uncultured Cohaesibacter sp. TaxID=1002546 RepID=UPI0029C5FED3|nr:head-tail connector protein [uncultured Cohaesibacter sp.]
MPAILLTAPAIEPVSLSEIKAYLKIDQDAEDDLLRAFISAARVHLEHITGCHLITQSWRILLEGPLGETFRLPLQPVSELLALHILEVDGTSTEIDIAGLSIFQTGNPAIIANLDGFLLSYRQRLQIDVETGFGPAAEDVPEPLRLAMKMIVAEWYERRLIADPAQIAALNKALQPMITPYRSIHL